jgi:hypothetical protein
VVAADPSLVDPDVVRRVIAGWPPVALAISAELALQLRSSDGNGGDRRIPNRSVSPGAR